MTRDEFDQILSQHGLACIGETTWHIAQFIVAHEREACARLCETPIDEIQITDDISELRYMDAQECAAAIRKRGENS